MSNIGHINMPERVTNGTLHTRLHHHLFSAIIKKKRILKNLSQYFGPLSRINKNNTAGAGLLARTVLTEKSIE
jgi:hypothetical protein